MSQPVLMAALALVAAVVVTAAIAVVTFANGNTWRAIRLTIVGAAAALTALAIQHAHLRINFTASMPIGIYSLSPLPAAGVKRGMVVVACAPVGAAALGRSRGYLGTGPCSDGTEPLLKSVAAIAGDEVEVTAAGVAINGCRLPRSTPLARDRSGRRLGPWPDGRYRLGPGQAWLYADNGRSWDSRYWGPATEGDLMAEALPVVILPGGVDSKSRPGCGGAQLTPHPRGGLRIGAKMWYSPLDKSSCVSDSLDQSHAAYTKCTPALCPRRAAQGL